MEFGFKTLKVFLIWACPTAIVGEEQTNFPKLGVTAQVQLNSEWHFRARSGFPLQLLSAGADVGFPLQPLTRVKQKTDTKAFQRASLGT